MPLPKHHPTKFATIDRDINVHTVSANRGEGSVGEHNGDCEGGPAFRLITGTLGNVWGVPGLRRMTRRVVGIGKIWAKAHSQKIQNLQLKLEAIDIDPHLTIDTAEP